MSKARRHAWAHGTARHGGLPPVRVADRRLEGVTCIRLDATVVTAHSDKELAEPNFKGYGHHPIIAACDNTGEPLAWMLRPGSAGSNTAADHIAVLDAALVLIPDEHRYGVDLLIRADTAGCSRAFLAHIRSLRELGMAPLRCGFGGHGEASRGCRSDRRCELGECRGHPQAVDCFGGKFVMAAAHVLQECEPADDDLSSAVGA